MIFIDDEYSQEYFTIIQGAQLRASTRAQAADLYQNCVIERHHVIPECFFKNRKRKGPPGWIEGNSEKPENIVFLEAKDHYRVHQLLIKMTLIDSQYQKMLNQKMNFAFVQMSYGTKNKEKYQISDIDYEFLRELRGSARKGAHMSAEAKAKLSASKKGKKVGPHSVETRAKISAGQIGNKRGPETGEKIRQRLLGRKRSPESIAKQHETLKLKKNQNT